MTAVVIDWTTVFVLIAVNGVIDCGAVAYLAGRQSKKKLVAYLNSSESDPLVDRITLRVADKVEERMPPFPQMPVVPTLEEIANEVEARLPPLPKIPTVSEIIAEIPPYPDITDKLSLLEERMGAKLTAVMEAKWALLGDQLSTRVGQVVQANIASAKSQFAAANRDLSEAMGPDNDGSMLTEVLGIFMDEDSVKKVGRAKAMFKRFQAQGGLRGSGAGAAAQGGYPYGTVMNGYVATPGGWVPVQRQAAPAALPAAPAPAPAPLPASDLPPVLPAETASK